MFIPKRHRRHQPRSRLECPACRTEGRDRIIGRIIWQANGVRVLHVTKPGAHAKATDTDRRWIVTCACGRVLRFQGDDVILQPSSYRTEAA